jgi:hypothetical protein
MLLSKSQQQHFWRKWAAVKSRLKASEYTDAQCENERHALLQRAGFNSLTRVDPRAGFDSVLAQLGAMLDDINRTIETEDKTIGEARRLRYVIKNELLRCLALYEPDAEHYLQSVIQDKIRWFKLDAPNRLPTLEDLTAKPTLKRTPPCYTLQEFPSQLEQIVMTINARLQTKRKAAGHSVCDMRNLAGLPCGCSKCARRVIARTMSPEPALVTHGESVPENDNCPF